MDAFLNALNMFFTTFKAAVFVPVFIFVIALAMGGAGGVIQLRSPA